MMRAQPKTSAIHPHPSPTPTCPTFNFNISSEATVQNWLHLKHHNFDMQAALNAQPKSRQLRIGILPGHAIPQQTSTLDKYGAPPPPWLGLAAQPLPESDCSRLPGRYSKRPERVVSIHLHCRCAGICFCRGSLLYQSFVCAIKSLYVSVPSPSQLRFFLTTSNIATEICVGFHPHMSGNQACGYYCDMELSPRQEGEVQKNASFNQT